MTCKLDDSSRTAFSVGEQEAKIQKRYNNHCQKISEDCERNKAESYCCSLRSKDGSSYRMRRESYRDMHIPHQVAQALAFAVTRKDRTVAVAHAYDSLLERRATNSSDDDISDWYADPGDDRMDHAFQAGVGKALVIMLSVEFSRVDYSTIDEHEQQAMAIINICFLLTRMFRWCSLEEGDRQIAAIGQTILQNFLGLFERYHGCTKSSSTEDLCALQALHLMEAIARLPTGVNCLLLKSEQKIIGVLLNIISKLSFTSKSLCAQKKKKTAFDIICLIGRRTHFSRLDDLLLATEKLVAGADGSVFGDLYAVLLHDICAQEENFAKLHNIVSQFNTSRCSRRKKIAKKVMEKISIMDKSIATCEQIEEIRASVKNGSRKGARQISEDSCNKRSLQSSRLVRGPES
mmetsp:Transcript_1317/g.2095  ORF Transcript_1317/g.2095 Transcript_1317/m.2095 type:complete len:405 (+) Transcript_1317:102-1316(+)